MEEARKFPLFRGSGMEIELLFKNIKFIYWKIEIKATALHEGRLKEKKIETMF